MVFKKKIMLLHRPLRLLSVQKMASKMRFAAAIAASNIFSLQNSTGIPSPNDIVAGYAIRNLIVEIKIYIFYIIIKHINTQWDDVISCATHKVVLFSLLIKCCCRKSCIWVYFV